MDTWVQYSPALNRQTLVFAGTDKDGSAMYVGRANHSCDLIPGKLLTSNHRCHVSYNGQEHSIACSEVLINSNYIWIPCADGNVPPNAIIGGRTVSGETLYVGRANHCGTVTPGKVHPSHQCLYLPFGGKELRFTSYEVLVRQQHNCPPVQPPPCNCHSRPGCPPCNCRRVICPPLVQLPIFPPCRPHSPKHRHKHGHRKC